jgi:hypothetical protein
MSMVELAATSAVGEGPQVVDLRPFDYLAALEDGARKVFPVD